MLYATSIENSDCVSDDRRTHDEVGGARSARQLARGSSLARHRRCRLCARVADVALPEPSRRCGIT